MGVNPTDPDRRARGADPSRQSSDQLSDGPSALAVHLPPLLATAGVRTVQLDVLTRAESFRGATISPQAQEITGSAREEHRRRHFGFWEFVLARASSTDTETRHGLIHGAARWASNQLLDGQCGLRISTDLETALPPHHSQHWCELCDLNARRRRFGR